MSSKEKLKVNEFKNQKVSILHLKVLRRFAQYAIGNKLSVKTCRQILSWDFKLRKEESRLLLKELKDLGFIEFKSNKIVVIKLPISQIISLKESEKNEREN